MNMLLSAVVATLLAADAESPTTRASPSPYGEVVWRHVHGDTVFVFTLRDTTGEPPPTKALATREYVLRSYHGAEDKARENIEWWRSTSEHVTDQQGLWKLYAHAAARFDTPQPNAPRATTVVFLYTHGYFGLSGFARLASAERKHPDLWNADWISVDAILFRRSELGPGLDWQSVAIHPGKGEALARVTARTHAGSRERPGQSLAWDLVLDNNRLRFRPAEP